MKLSNLHLGIDIGSTTIKLIVVNSENQVIYKDYQRHNTRVRETLLEALHKCTGVVAGRNIRVMFTGSGGMGISERFNLPFIQEVIASAEVVGALYPDVSTLIDMGGEDSKMIFFKKGKSPDIRMNGSCAGGTGAFIDQMAGLLNIPVIEMDALALNAATSYPIASRCGVFAKTDIQNLLSRKICKEDIAISIFDAVALQTVNTLARGYEITPKVLLCGGPLTFFTALRKSFAATLKLEKQDIIIPQHSEFIPALGAAFSCSSKEIVLTHKDLLNIIQSPGQNLLQLSSRKKALFTDMDEMHDWFENRTVSKISTRDIAGTPEADCFIGIDSGSTTTKIAVTDVAGRLLFSHYVNNNGNPLDAIIGGLTKFQQQAESCGSKVRILQTAITGYGEDLIKAALAIDHGIVETIAHFMAAKKIEDNVSFIIDIGGQDIKAIFIENNIIQHIEINEACSSGCGSFIEGFANSLGYEVKEFARIACEASSPCDLGTRCTVFMNSKVKQSLREGASAKDIAAGLAYSVINNCLNKVLKVTDMSKLGGNIVAQGGSFKNPAVLRALESLTGKKITISDRPEIMGAYGAALYAIEKFNAGATTSTFSGFDRLTEVQNYRTKIITCKGCNNFCQVSGITFPNNNTFYSGNKCENVFRSKAAGVKKGQNIYEYKNRLLFDRTGLTPGSGSMKIGIPRILNMYENYPFWNELFTGCGMEVVISDPSDDNLYKKGAGSIMSDNICFPAKLAHGHVFNLVEKKADRIFFPLVVYEKIEPNNSINSFNCPVVTGYAEVLKSSIDTEKRFGIPFDSPSVSFKDDTLLKKACWQYLKSLGVKKKVFETAFSKALNEQITYKKSIHTKIGEILDSAKITGRQVIVLAGHPYHTDLLIQHKTSQLLADMGVDVINEEWIDTEPADGIMPYFLVPQWAYPNRILHAASIVAKSSLNIEFVQMNSFGCGPDAFIINEIGNLLKANSRTYTLIRIDEITSTGSVYLRLRSLIESLKIRKTQQQEKTGYNVSRPARFEMEDKRRTILIPWFSDFYSPFLPTLGELSGYKVENLPPPDITSVEYGLKYSHNDICYPATLIVGDIVKAIKSGKYNPDEVAFGMTQTGGQCRATNYIAIIKRALSDAGYGTVPVISVASSSGTINDQPGFKMNWTSLLRIALSSLLFADSLSRMYHSVIFRECEKGACDAARKKYLEAAIPYIRKKDISGLFKLLRTAVEEFNHIPVIPGNFPVTGVVGEIYVKYNTYGHYNMIKWLNDQKVEVVVPSLVHFMLQAFVNTRANQDENIEKASPWVNLLLVVLKKYLNTFLNKNERIISQFRFYRPLHDIKESAGYASEIINLVNQFGEGWLIPAEIACFAKSGVNDIISMQPFGCIANHIISKGVEKKIKTKFPDVNLLFLDFDSGTSEVNVQNRLYFMIKSAMNPVLPTNGDELTPDDGGIEKQDQKEYEHSLMAQPDFV